MPQCQENTTLKQVQGNTVYPLKVVKRGCSSKDERDFRSGTAYYPITATAVFWLLGNPDEKSVLVVLTHHPLRCVTLHDNAGVLKYFFASWYVSPMPYKCYGLTNKKFFSSICLFRTDNFLPGWKKKQEKDEFENSFFCVWLICFVSNCTCVDGLIQVTNVW